LSFTRIHTIAFPAAGSTGIAFHGQDKRAINAGHKANMTHSPQVRIVDAEHVSRKASKNASRYQITAMICIVAISLIRADRRDHDEQDGSDIK